MEDEKIKRINAVLANCGLTVDALSPKKIQLLLKADDAIQERIACIRKAEATIKQKSINIQNIAFDTNIARKTFYNNEEVRLFVECCAEEFYSERIENKETIKNLKNKITELEKTVQEFVFRDIETENLRKELSATRRELAHIQIVNQELRDKQEKILRENGKAVSQNKCKILIPQKNAIGHSDKI